MRFIADLQRKEEEEEAIPDLGRWVMDRIVALEADEWADKVMHEAEEKGANLIPQTKYVAWRMKAEQQSITAAAVMVLMRYLLAWTAEEGGRNLGTGNDCGARIPRRHDEWRADQEVGKPLCTEKEDLAQDDSGSSNILSPFVPTGEGRETQERVLGTNAAKIEKIQPGILVGLGLQA